jgi:hypothetical protein
MTPKRSNQKSQTQNLTLREGTILVKLAREAITCYIERKTTIKPPSSNGNLVRKSGVFVTLNTFKTHALRGCIGFPYPDQPLIEATVKAAIYAATEDPRFEPVSIDEFEHAIAIELTALTAPQPLTVANRMALPELIEIGRHGLIVEGMRSSGLLLPQVAVEWEWNGADFLTNCCLKAGLPPDSWLLNEVTVKVFEGEIFEEIEPAGEVKKRSFGG